MNPLFEGKYFWADVLTCPLSNGCVRHDEELRAKRVFKCHTHFLAFQEDDAPATESQLTSAVTRRAANATDLVPSRPPAPDVMLT